MGELPESLQTIAQIGVTIAGFSGLIVALRRDPGVLTPLHKYRLQVLLSLSLGAMFLSLLPELLATLGVVGRPLWTIASLAVATFSAVFLAWWIVASVRLRSTDPDVFNWFAVSRMSAGHAAVMILQLAFVFGWLDLPGAGAYLAGLAWYLLHAAQQFIRMLYVRPRSDLERR